MLQPSDSTKILLAKTRAKAKMYEFSVPENEHFDIGSIPLNSLLDLTIAMLGDLTASGADGDADYEKYKLLFSAQYFDSLIQSKTIVLEKDYLKLLSAAAYYLSGYPGSAGVILGGIKHENVNLFGNFEKILYELVRREKININFEQTYFQEEMAGFKIKWNIFLQNGSNGKELLDLINNLRNLTYLEGSDRELLMIDCIRAVVFRRIKMSTWALLPKFSKVNLTMWGPYLEREKALKELWPAQVLLGEQGVFNGNSAVVQMPTSAGKTRSCELIIRSSFLSRRSSLAIIVAPFRSLCQEIYNNFVDHFYEDQNININIASDILQEDVENFDENKNVVLILTPEKFDFLIRHNTNLVTRLGLVIYDEGHLFDDESRGIKYELLLASLKKQLPENVQTVLISAVISNAQQIKDWLIGQNGTVVEAKNLNPTNRSLAFTSWITSRGSLEFVDEKNINTSLFFVPRLLETQKLQLKDNERKIRFFPEKISKTEYKAGDVAGFLGCRLSSEGLAAVFTGRKDSALNIAENIVDAYDRGLRLRKPIEFIDSLPEAKKLLKYIEQVLGPESIQASAAKLGILIHHGSTPHGLRLSIESALQQAQFKTVICTSTLAQGVNLPIRYLVIATDRQGPDQMKVRDFHNLMGRAGRSGKYTEGTIIFANPKIYDTKKIGKEKWRWRDAWKITDSNNSEPCTSRLLYLFEPAPEDDDEKNKWATKQAAIKNEISSQLLNILCDVVNVREMEKNVSDLAQNTLGYSQLDTEEKKSALVNIFLEIGSEIMESAAEIHIRKIFAKSILSLKDSKLLYEDLYIIIPQLKNTNDTIEVLDKLWDTIYKYSNDGIKKLKENDALLLCKSWINGTSYIDLQRQISPMKLVSGRKFKLDQIVDLCEGGFGYVVSLLLGSISELLNLSENDIENIEDIKNRLGQLQKMVKYGLPDIFSILIYEAGLADRRLSIELSSRLSSTTSFPNLKEIGQAISQKPELQDYIKNNYPAYFSERLDYILKIAGRSF